MSAAWMLTEQQLVDMLNHWRGAHLGDSFSVHLFQNDYVPVDETEVGDLEECDFDGYEAAGFDPGDFATATWTPYVAQLLATAYLNFTADSGMTGSQIAYGYYMFDGDDNFLWAERWDTPYEFSAASVLNMKPALRQKTCRD